MKKRFIQQLARNIDIGPSAHDITASKLTEAFEHISRAGGVRGSVTGSTSQRSQERQQISKQDLARWMNDLNLDFLSEKDFDRLWDAMDLHHKGTVDPLDFFSFLKECETQFQQVHGEYSNLPKSEKLKLASRRLSTINAVGGSIEEVEKAERRNNKRQRMNVHGGSLPMDSSQLQTEGSESSRFSFLSLPFGKFRKSSSVQSTN